MMLRTSLALCAIVALAACGEKPQTLGSSAKQDAAAHTGTGKAYVETTWKQGDKTSWESALRARTQNGQNDYAKTN
jgi:ABC-type glycerol-3-phosphate transport system substrate-binding protein